MLRFRLRFQLQEVELRQGDTLIGRSPYCHVSIEDPLVSREHTRIHLTAEGLATVEDLGSRNGTRLNGERLTEPKDLRDGDRVRIGTQDLVYSVLDIPEQQSASARTTGFMTRCAACEMPYPAESPACPTCGATERIEDDTLSGVGGSNTHNWTLQLIVDVLARAQQAGKEREVDRLLKRARSNIESRLASGLGVDVQQLENVTQAAAWLARQEPEPWACWALDIHVVAKSLPTAETAQLLAAVDSAHRSGVAESALRLLQGVESQGGPNAEEKPRFLALQALTQ